MLSRVADTLYWLSRYLERAAHTARQLDVNLESTLDNEPEAIGPHWQRLLASLQMPPATPEQLADEDSLVQSLTFDPKHPGSIVRCLEIARENARQARDRISSEMWEQINRLYLQLKLARLEALVQSQPHDFFQAVIEGAMVFQGVADSTMCHDEGWQFLQIGRYLERANATAALLDAHAPVILSRFGTGQLDWIGLLRCGHAFEAYCKTYTADPRPEQIVEFLLLNHEFPHSVRFAIDAVHAAAERLVRAETARGSKTGRAERLSGRAERLTGRLSATLSFGQVDEILVSGLRSYLDDIRRHCGLIHSAVFAQYISYSVESALAV